MSVIFSDKTKGLTHTFWEKHTLHMVYATMLPIYLLNLDGISGWVQDLNQWIWGKGDCLSNVAGLYPISWWLTRTKRPASPSKREFSSRLS